ncbi:MAG: hypothetical protein LBG62_00025 [Candidatus Methanoplasma sp.]|jgi:hypothetical protein|nr:hypothetical protein [Candidatus Methanoplasma sp.]
MNVLSAHLEPYADGDDLGIAAVIPGRVEHIPSSTWFDRQRRTDAEMEAFEKIGLNFRWALPRKPLADPFEPPAGLIDIQRRITLCLARYVWFPNDDWYDVISNWVIGTYFRDQFRTQPLLIFDGITVSGKSTVMKVLKELVYRGELMSSGSGAAMAREITDYDTTILLDEILDSLNSDRGQDIHNIMKSCFDKNGMWIRADPKGRGNYKYNTYTSLAVSIKGAALPEDVYNRGIRINMTAMPSGTELGDIECADEDDCSSPDSPISIRTDLYALKLWTMKNPVAPQPDPLDPAPEANPHSADFHSHYNKMRSHFTQRTEDGRWMYAFVHDMPADSPQIRDRKRKIAGTLYTIGLATGTEDSVIRVILEQDKWNREIAADTPESLAFTALAELVEEEWGRMKNVYGRLTVPALCAILDGINTTMIADRYNDILADQGNAGRDRVQTKFVTSKIAALGLAFKRGNGNKSFLDPSEPRFVRNYVQNVYRWAPDRIGAYRHLDRDRAEDG